MRVRSCRTGAVAWVSLGCVRATVHVQIDLSWDAWARCGHARCVGNSCRVPQQRYALWNHEIHLSTHGHPVLWCQHCLTPLDHLEVVELCFWFFSPLFFILTIFICSYDNIKSEQRWDEVHFGVVWSRTRACSRTFTLISDMAVPDLVTCPNKARQVWSVNRCSHRCANQRCEELCGTERDLGAGAHSRGGTVGSCVFASIIYHSVKAGEQARRNCVTKHQFCVGVLCWFRTFEQRCQEHFYIYTWPMLATYYKLSLSGKHTFLQQRCNIKWTGLLLYWMLRDLPVHCKLTQANWHAWFFFLTFKGRHFWNFQLEFYILTVLKINISVFFWLLLKYKLDPCSTG